MVPTEIDCAFPAVGFDSEGEDTNSAVLMLQDGDKPEPSKLTSLFPADEAEKNPPLVEPTELIMTFRIDESLFNFSNSRSGMEPLP
jgi:hypothetical protein